MFKAMSPKNGFTLMEVMIAVSILVMIMGLAWGSYALATQHQQRMQDINERLHGAEQAINHIVRDLSMAFMTVHGQDESQIKKRYETGFVGDRDRVDFTTMAYERRFKNEKVGDQSEISYFVKTVRNLDGQMVPSLVRREQAPINDDFRKGGTIIPLLEEVRNFQLLY